MRKFDFYGQIVLILLGGISAVMALYQGGYLVFTILMLIPLGLWQLISAAMLSFNKEQPGNRAILKNYWIAAGLCLAMFTISSMGFRTGTGMQVGIIFTSMGLSFLVALYYLYLYKKHFLSIEDLPIVETA